MFSTALTTWGCQSWALLKLDGAGLLGMVFYAIFAGAPIIIVGFLGVEIQKRIPRVYSFSDYVQRVIFFSNS